MKNLPKLLLAASASLIMSCTVQQPIPVKESMNSIQQSLINMHQSATDYTKYPRSAKKDGSLVTVPSRDWTSGFFPGSLWLMYDYTNDRKWEEMAKKWTAGLEKEKYNRKTHDLGFIMFNTFSHQNR